MGVIVRVDLRGLVPWQQGQEALVRQSAQRAGSDALRAMRAEASRLIRARKNMKAAGVRDALKIVKPSSRHAFVWAVSASGDSVPIYDFGGVRQLGKPGKRDTLGRLTKGRKVKGGRGGVQVEINKGSRKVIRGAFIATMKSGHVGVFRREGKKRLGIHELFTTTVADAFSDAMPAVSARGQEVFVSAFKRNMKMVATQPGSGTND